MLSRKSPTSKSVSARSMTRFQGAARGILSGLTPQGEPIVDFVGNPAAGGVAAMTTVAVSEKDVGKEVVLLFEDCDASRPLLVGLVRLPGETSPALDIKMDGQTLALTAEHEISLRCGDSSITLTRSGKVLIKGNYLLSRSTGPNRIKGGSVQLN